MLVTKAMPKHAEVVRSLRSFATLYGIISGFRILALESDRVNRNHVITQSTLFVFNEASLLVSCANFHKTQALPPEIRAYKKRHPYAMIELSVVNM
ncbi:hypothetical protein SAMN05421832_11161 [Psychrobacillus psychrodurans]|nr:hypothetical protein SAMN05421832_11161 [Psychrobacillus psychrodurans]